MLRVEHAMDDLQVRFLLVPEQGGYLGAIIADVSVPNSDLSFLFQLLVSQECTGSSFSLDRLSALGL